MPLLIQGHRQLRVAVPRANRHCVDLPVPDGLDSQRQVVQVGSCGEIGGTLPEPLRGPSEVLGSLGIPVSEGIPGRVDLGGRPPRVG